MTDEQIIAAAKKIDTPHGKVGLIHVREDGQEVPTFMAKQFAAELLAELESENARLLMANRDCVDHFNQLKEEYDALVGPPQADNSIPAAVVARWAKHAGFREVTPPVEALVNLLLKAPKQRDAATEENASALRTSLKCILDRYTHIMLADGESWTAERAHEVVVARAALAASETSKIVAVSVTDEKDWYLVELSNGAKVRALYENSQPLIGECLQPKN